MTRRRAWKSLSLIVVGTVLPVGMHATQSWDLTGLYSGASNPDGVYSYRDLSGNLFNTLNSTTTNINWDILAFSGFSGNRWTTSAGTDMAGFAKNTGWTSAAVNWPNFSIGGVSYDIRWTAPFDTTITVGGDVWMMRDDTNP